MNIFDLHYSLNLNQTKVENPMKYLADAIISGDEISISLNIGNESFTSKVTKEYILKETEIGKRLIKGCERFQSLRQELDIDQYTIQGEIVSAEYVNSLIEAVLYD